MSHIHQNLHRRMAKLHDLPNWNELEARDPAAAPESTILSVVFVTATPTFTGSIAGYTTLTDAAATSTDGSSPSTDSNTSATAGFDFGTISDQSTSTSADATSTSNIQSEATTSSSNSIVPIANTTPLTSAAVATTVLTSAAASVNSNTAASATASSQASSNTSSSGLSTMGKFGLAIGLIVLLAALAALALFLFWKKRQRAERYRRAADEKTSFGSAAAPRAPMLVNQTNSAPPRLSLRPVSKLLPDMMGGPKKRASQGNPLITLNQPSDMSGSGRNLTPSPRSGSPWERRADEHHAPAANPFNDPENPFTDSARVAAPVTTGGLSSSNGAIAAGVGVVATGTGLAAIAANANHGAPRPLSPSSAAPSRTVTPVGNGPPSNVYRVLIDFKPTMDDELELRTGQLVRLVKEFDDGWALCVRLDGSQQGAAPRTCLAAKASIPRNPNAGPRGPGPNNPRPLRPGQDGRMSPAMSRPTSAVGYSNQQMPQQRNRNPNSADSRPGTANSDYRSNSPSQSYRSQSPGPGAYNLAPRPLSPGPRPQSKRSMSPGPYGPGAGCKPIIPASQRRRSNSASAVRERRESPPGPSKLGPGAPSVGNRQRLAGAGVAF